MRKLYRDNTNANHWGQRWAAWHSAEEKTHLYTHKLELFIRAHPGSTTAPSSGQSVSCPTFYLFYPELLSIVANRPQAVPTSDPRPGLWHLCSLPPLPLLQQQQQQTTAGHQSQANYGFFDVAASQSSAENLWSRGVAPGSMASTGIYWAVFACVGFSEWQPPMESGSHRPPASGMEEMQSFQRLPLPVSGGSHQPSEIRTKCFHCARKMVCWWIHIYIYIYIITGFINN